MTKQTPTLMRGSKIEGRPTTSKTLKNRLLLPQRRTFQHTLKAVFSWYIFPVSSEGELQVYPGACWRSFPLSRPFRLHKFIHSWGIFQEHTSQENPSKPQLRCGDANIQGRTDSKCVLLRWNWSTCTAPVRRCSCLTKVANAITRPTAGTERGSRSSSGPRSRKNFFFNWSPLVPWQSFFSGNKSFSKL